MKHEIVLIAITLIGSSLFAQEEKRSTMHEGLYFSMAGGAAFGSVRTSVNEANFITRGGAIGTDVQAGLSIRPNLFVHATAQFGAVVKPVVNGAKLDNSLMIERLYGVGVTRYSSTNFLFTANAGVCKFLLLKKSKDFTIAGLSTDPGFSFSLKAGKEWAVSNKCALGAILFWSRTFVHNNAVATDEGININYLETWSSNRFGIYLQASFFSGK